MKNNQDQSSHGGARKGAGRKKGQPNKATAAFKELAQKYTETALTELARLSTEADNEATRVSAIKEIFDRAYGRAAQSVDVQGDMSFQGLRVVVKRD